MKIAKPDWSIVLTALASILPLTAVAQQAPAEIDTNNVIPRFYLTSFSPSAPGGFFIFAGNCPTNLCSISGDTPVYMDVNHPVNPDFRDSSMIKIGGTYFVVYNDENSNSCAIISSPDMVHWSQYATIYVPFAQYYSFWSPKFILVGTTVYLTAFVQSSHDGNYWMGAGVMTSDLKTLYDFNVMHLCKNPASGKTDPNSSAVYYYCGVFYLFTGDGNEYTSDDILGDDWTYLTGCLAYGAGKTVAELNGVFYLTASELGSIAWSISTDLTNWTNVQLPDAVRPQLGTIGREGCFYTEFVPGASADSVQVSIVQTNSTITLSWPAIGNYMLLQSPDLSNGSWTTNSVEPVYLNGIDSVIIPTTQAKMFYRLKD